MTSTLADDQGWSSGSLVSSNPKLEYGSYSLLSACSWAVLIPLVHYYHHHVRNPAVPRIRRTAWVWLKLVLAASLLCLEVSSLVLRCSFSPHRHHITALTVTSDIASAAGIATAVHLEHRRGVPASALLSLYIAIGLFKDVGKAQLYFFRGQSALSQLAATSASLRLALLCIQEFVEPELIIGPWSQPYSHRTLGSFCGRALSPISQTLQAWFWTVLSVDRSGNLGPEFAPASSFAALCQRSKSSQQRRGSSLLIDCLMTWKMAVLAAAIPRFGVTAFIFTQPWLIRCMILSHRQEASEPLSLRLVGAIFLVYNGAAFCRAAAAHLKSRLVMKIRAALISQILAKSQKLRLLEAKKHTAVALISSEIDNVSDGFANFVDTPVFVVDACLGMYLLVSVVRQAAFIIFLPLILASILGYVYGIYLTPALRKWNQNIESRVARTARMLAQLPTIKMLGLAPKAGDFLRHLWITEIESSWDYWKICAAFISSAGFVDMITPAIVIAGAVFWRIFSPGITAELVFPTLGLISRVQDPLSGLLKSGPSTVALLSSFRRIQEYLSLEEAHDPRVLLSPRPRDVTRYWPTEEDTQALSTRSVQQDPTRVIYFDNVNIAPVGMDTPLLSNVNVSIAPSSVTTIFGPTGLGKTTLLNGIIGEAEISGGVLYVDDVSIAVCGQLLWLPDMTILQFIIGASAYDAAWFRTVVTVCMLDEDIDQFRDGEQHQIGSGGMKLSGGQRQRLCLARAIYVKASIILLDDVLSAVDRLTALAILFGLCGKENGLLRRLNSTVVLTGYLPECFDVADSVLLIDAYGKIEHRSGTDLDDPQLACVIRLLYHDGAGEDGSESESEPEAPRERNCRTISPEPAPELDEEQPQGAVQRLTTRQRPQPRLYKVCIDAIGRRRLQDWFLLMLIMSLAEGFPAIYMRWWIETSPTEKLHIFGYAFLSATAGLLGGPCLIIMGLKLSPRASIGLHDTLTDAVVHSTLGFLSANSSGSVLNRYSVDMGLITRQVSKGVYNNIYLIITTLFHIAIVLFGADYMAALLPLFVVLIFAIQRKYIHASRELHVRDIEYREQLVTLFRETGDGIDYIRGFGWQDFIMQHNFDLVDKSQTPFYLLLCTQQLLALSLDLVSSNLAAALSAITLCIYGSATESSSGLAFQILMILSTSLNRTLTAWTSLETALGSVEHVSDFLESTPVESDSGTTPLPENWPAHGRVEMTNVSAGYLCDRREEQNPAVIHNITLSVEPGQKVGIMGRTGGGKSSLLMSLLGLLEYEGNIVIDGVDIRQAPGDQLRSRIITITQDSVEFEGTIRDNLLPFEKDWAGVVPKTADATEAEKRRREFILRETLVHLRLWPMLEDKKELETLVSDAGFSYGERQLLCIARAAVHRRVYGGKLVLVDEATGGVDAWRDQIVREMIRDYFRGCTVMVVAHRSETVADSNISFKMVRGRVKSYKHWF